MPEKAWAYYSSASDDEITNRENHAAFHRSVFLLISRFGRREIFNTKVFFDSSGYGSGHGFCVT